jgi:ELWxxDGT repeat protein
MGASEIYPIKLASVLRRATQEAGPLAQQPIRFAPRWAEHECKEMKVITQKGNVRARAGFESLEARRLLSANLVADYGGIYPTDSVIVNGVSFFAANDGVHGMELWKSDGTADGTAIVKDIVRGGGSSNIISMTAFNGRSVIFFTANRDGTRSLWRSDGTAGGTQELKNLGPARKLTSDVLEFQIRVANGRAMFVIHGVDGSVNLWASDGTTKGTTSIFHMYDDPPETRYLPRLVTIGTRVMIADGMMRMWSTDGTAAGTFEVTRQEISDPSRPQTVLYLPTEINGTAVFLALREDGMIEVWRTDGTRAGTSRIGGATGGGTGVLVQAGNRLFFQVAHEAAYSADLWSTDGTAAGTSKVVKLSGSPYAMAPMPDGRLLLLLQQQHTYEIWTSDGTAAGTVPVASSQTGRNFGGAFLPAGGLFFFMIDPTDGADPAAPAVLWRTDGTTAGTVAVQDLASANDVRKGLIDVVDQKLVIAIPGQETLVFDPTTMAAPVGPAKATLKLADGVLRVFGTRGNDSIRVYRMASDDSRFVVDLNGVKRSFAFASVRKLIVYGYAGDDAIAFNEANGLITLRSLIWSGAGDDTIWGDSSRDTIWGEAGEDLINAGRSADMVDGGSGDDTIYGSTGNDTLSGQDGQDSLIGGRGDDLISGGNDASDDHLDGGSGADVIFGNAVYEIFYNGKQTSDGDPVDEILLG